MKLVASTSRSSSTVIGEHYLGGQSLVLMQGLHIRRNTSDEINENLLLKRNEFLTKRGGIYM